MTNKENAVRLLGEANKERSYRQTDEARECARIHAILALVDVAERIAVALEKGK